MSVPPATDSLLWRSLVVPIPDEIVSAIAERAAAVVVASLSDRPDYMTTDAVAAYLAWPKKRIDNLCAQQRIPFRKDGGRRIFIRQEIDEWVSNLAGTSVRQALAAW